MLHTGNPTVLARNCLRAVEVAHERNLERFVDERRFARTGNSGNDRERTDWNSRGDIFEVVLRCTVDGEEMLELAFLRGCIRRNGFAAGQIVGSQRV